MILLTLLAMLVLLLLKGFFSGSEMALVSANRIKLRQEAARDNAGARVALNMMKNPPTMLTTTLLGTNITTIALGTVGTLLMVRLFGDHGELVSVIVYTPLFLIFGEIVPKSVYQQKADTITPWIAYPLSWLQIVFAPLIYVFSAVGIFVARAVGGTQDPANVAREQFLSMLQMAESSGTVSAAGGRQVRRVLRYAQMTAAEGMWPLSDVRCLEEGSMLSDIVTLRRNSAQRLIPLYEGSHARIKAVAILESWDLLDEHLLDRQVEDFLRPLHFVPRNQRMTEVIELLTDHPDWTVVVVDELGNAQGLINLNLLVRRTLGVRTNPATGRKVATAGPDLRFTDEGSIVIDARTPIAKVNERLHTTLSTLTHSTMGGLALDHFGRLPDVGMDFEADGYRFTIRSVDDRSVLSLTASQLSDSRH